MPVIGQNLVPNSSFEDYKYLSCNPNEFFDDFMYDWSQPLRTSTDYWHEAQYERKNCPRMFMTPPFLARSGQAMVGIITYEYVTEDYYSNYREYLHTQLLNSVKAKKTYAIEFFYRTDNYSDLVSSHLGIYFSNQ